VIYMHHPMSDLGILDSTWGGNLADMVRFCQEMKVVEEEKLIEKIPEKTSVLVTGLQEIAEKHPDKIYNIRGMGIYQGFSLRKKEQLHKLVDVALEKESMILLEAGVDTIRFRSALDVTVDDIRLMIEKLERCLRLI
jgi:L-lysine 6-transaminase